MKQTVFKILSVLVGLLIAITLIFVADRILINKPFFLSIWSAPEFASHNPPSLPDNLVDQTVMSRLASEAKARFAKVSGHYNKYDGDFSNPTTDQNGNSVFRVQTHTDTGSVIYDVNYTIDFQRRRITPQQNMDRSVAVLFFGCSLIFGEGLQDNQTLPYYFSQKHPEVTVYNMGANGLGLNNIYHDIVEEPSPRYEVKQKKIIVVFGASSSHFTRLRCDLRCLNPRFTWITKKPNYILKGDEIVREGNVGEFYKNPALKWLGTQLRFFRFVQFDQEHLYDSESLNLHYALLKAIREKLSRRYEVVDFVQAHLVNTTPTYVNYLESGNKGQIKSFFIPPLPGGLEAGMDSGLIIPIDGHATEATNYYSAQILSYQLQQAHPDIFKKTSP